MMRGRTPPTKAEAPVAIPYTTRVTVNTVRRPTRSARAPPNVAPTAIPMKPAETMRDCSVALEAPLLRQHGNNVGNEANVHCVERPP